MATWTCPEDGTENPLAEKRCLVCRHPNLPRVVVLTSVATGKEAEFTEPLGVRGHAIPPSHADGAPASPPAHATDCVLIADCIG